MSRRPRYASGSGTQGSVASEVVLPTREREPRLISAEFVEFRKRHIKQNKEIIATNVTTKIAMAAVQAEVYALRSEILEVRQRNLALRRELRKRSKAQGRGADVQPAQRQAVEAILAAVPALQQLLAHTLQVPPPTPESYPDWQADDTLTPTPNPPAACKMPLVYTSRPAAIAAAIKDKGLGPLVEGSECGSEVDSSDLEERRVRVANKARTSALASRSTRPASPPPIPVPILAPAPAPTPTPYRIPNLLPAAVTAIAKSPLLSSPSSRASPRRKSRGGEKARRRRESGLLLPIVPPIPAEHARSGHAESSGSQAEEEGQVEQDEDEEAVDGLVVADDEPEAGVERAEGVSRKGKERARARDLPPPQSLPSHLPRKPEFPIGPTQSEVIQPAEETRPVRSVSEEMGTEDCDGGNGGRGRRSRNSVVSYKEPSLNKKMRKPDGTPFEDATKLAIPSSSRSSLASGHSAPSSSSSHPDHSDFRQSDPHLIPLPADINDTHPASSRKQKPHNGASSSLPSAALRRKSTLPRPGRNRDGDSGGQTDGDNSEEEEEGHAEPYGVGRSASDNSLAVPPRPPTTQSGPQATRKSPRKSSPQKQAPPPPVPHQPIPSSHSRSSLVSGKRHFGGLDTGGTAVGVMGRGRDPLVDRNDNGQAGAKARDGSALAGMGHRSVSGEGRPAGDVRKVSA